MPPKRRLKRRRRLNPRFSILLSGSRESFYDDSELDLSSSRFNHSAPQPKSILKRQAKFESNRKSVFDFDRPLFSSNEQSKLNQLRKQRKSCSFLPDLSPVHEDLVKKDSVKQKPRHSVASPLLKGPRMSIVTDNFILPQDPSKRLRKQSLSFPPPMLKHKRSSSALRRRLSKTFGFGKTESLPSIARPSLGHIEFDNVTRRFSREQINILLFPKVVPSVKLYRLSSVRYHKYIDVLELLRE